MQEVENDVPVAGHSHPGPSRGLQFHGPDGLRATRGDYSQAIQQTNDQELLLNLVRLRYRDTLYFLNVARVASSLELNRSMAATASLPESANKTFTLGAGSLGFNEKPSVFYVPLEGEKFVRQMMVPFDLRLLVLLANSGWSVERVFMVMLREMNGVKNAPSASGPTPALAPEYAQFQEAAHLLRQLQINGNWIWAASRTTTPNWSCALDPRSLPGRRPVA